MVTTALKSCIDGMCDGTRNDVIDAEKVRLISAALVTAKAAAPLLCRKRHSAKTTCPSHTPPAQNPAVRRKLISKAATYRARSERIRQMERRGELERAAPVLTCADMAEFMFSLWTTASHSDMHRCLAQLAVLTYLFGSRLNEVFDLESSALDQASCRFQSVRKKKVREHGKLQRSSVYIAQATAEEQSDFEAVWQLMLLREGLLFEKRWSDAKKAARPFKKCQKELGLQHFKAVGGGSSLVTGHTFRRSRGVHLLQHGRKREDTQELHKHETWS